MKSVYAHYDIMVYDRTVGDFVTWPSLAQTRVTHLLIAHCRSTMAKGAPLITSAGRDHIILSKQLAIMIGNAIPFRDIPCCC